MRPTFAFLTLALTTAIGCSGTARTAPKPHQSAGSSAQCATPAVTSPQTAQAPSGPIAFTELYGGMIMARVTTPGVVPPSGSAKVRTIYLIRDAGAFASFKRRVPKNFISKGPDKPNTDPILSAASFDFSKNMLLVVEYDYMWVKPRVLTVTSKGGKLLVTAKFDEQMDIKQHANGVASYTAVSIPRSTLTPLLVSN